MAENTLDIVNLIENNPVTKLSNTYQSKLLQQIQHELTDEELNIFSTNFYCFLNYHPKNDFIIDSNGKISSKLKSIQETYALRFEKHGINPPTTPF
jgi:hypothetical protein